MRQIQRGFTPVELMIVVAIVGILAAVALPAYEDYAKRAKVSELILAASSCRATVSEVYLTGTQTFVAPSSWGCESASQTSRYVSSVATDGNGAITVTAASGIDIANADGKSILLTPTDSAGNPLMCSGGPGQQVGSWKCGPDVGFSTKLLPASCRG